MSRATPESAELRGTHVVLYDGVCALCNGVVRFLLARDPQRQFRFAALQSRFAADALAPSGERPEGLSTMFLIAEYGTENQRVFKKARAVLALLRILGGPWRIAAVAGILPTAILNLGYSGVAQVRYALFGRYDACPLPESEHRDLFIEL